jgi:hypothetical protein
VKARDQSGLLVKDEMLETKDYKFKNMSYQELCMIRNDSPANIASMMIMLGTEDSNPSISSS